MIPIAPSGLTLIIEGMKRALGRTPSSGEQARALDAWLPEIKNDIWFDDGASHELLETDALILLTEGAQPCRIPYRLSGSRGSAQETQFLSQTAQAGTT